jgi:hypothetical protein
MTQTPPKPLPKKRVLDCFAFSPRTRRQLTLVKRLKGWTKKTIVETAINDLVAKHQL